MNTSTKRCGGRERLPPEGHAARQLVDAIRVVSNGDALLSPTITRRVIEEFVLRPPASARKPPGLEELTRELEMLRYLRAVVECGDCAGGVRLRDDREDARCPHPPEVALADRVQAVVFAYENGVVAPREGP